MRGGSHRFLQGVSTISAGMTKSAYSAIHHLSSDLQKDTHVFTVQMRSKWSRSFWSFSFSETGHLLTIYINKFIEVSDVNKSVNI